MDRRVFLGWQRPLLGAVVDWLWERREEMPGMTVVVPTAQAGRRLREALAEKGACLAPRVVTPGWFLRSDHAAPAAAEVLAWVEVLEEVSDWSRFSTVFPVAPGRGEGKGWSLPLAHSLMSLERSLQEGAMTLEGAARRMSASVEAGRWAELSELGRLKELKLSSWSMESRSRVLERLARETVAGKVVLAGVPDLSNAAVRRLEGADVVVLIAAPEDEPFDAFGRPEEEAWKTRSLPLPESVELVADPRQQAEKAVEKVAEAGTSSDRLALGSADDEAAEELVRAFGRAGWVIHNPAGNSVSPTVGWLRLWRGWISKPEVASAIDLLGMRETEGLTGRMRLQRVVTLSQMRDQWLVRTREDVERVEPRELLRRAEREARSSGEMPALGSETMEKLEKARGAFIRQPFAEAMRRLLERVDPDAAWTEVRDWVESMKPVLSSVERDAGFWLDLMLGDLPEATKAVPEDRVADVQGWLELLHEPGTHLVICGMNEGRVPASPAADVWLNDGVRSILGLTTDARRSARDAYVFQALIHSRERVDLLLGKSSADGDALLPSRLLLAANGKELAERVEKLFQEVEPPDAGMKWHADWKWKVRVSPMKPRLSVTALKDYLACPTRFYLKHGAAMFGREPERVEWKARDFGNVVHLVLERWGQDDIARDFSKTEALDDWLGRELERVVEELYGPRPPLAVRIQAAGARQRLEWFARIQACHRAEGWRVAEVETKFTREIDGVVLVGKVDRIDQHKDGRRRILDYKTYKDLRDVEKDHRVGITASTVMPEHLQDVGQVVGTNAKGKPTRWTNLQVPLYASFFTPVDELGYFVLGATEAATGLSIWDEFSDDDRDSALACAEWVIGQVKAGVFEPAAERVEYDDFELLSMGRGLRASTEVQEPSEH